jgi:hypothetical protein
MPPAKNQRKQESDSHPGENGCILFLNAGISGGDQTPRRTGEDAGKRVRGSCSRMTTITGRGHE